MEPIMKKFWNTVWYHLGGTCLVKKSISSNRVMLLSILQPLPEDFLMNQVWAPSVGLVKALISTLLKILWGFMKKELKDFACRNADELFVKLESVWRDIPSKYLQGLCESMPRRIAKAIWLRGNKAPYWPFCERKWTVFCFFDIESSCVLLFSLCYIWF